MPACWAAACMDQAQCEPRRPIKASPLTRWRAGSRNSALRRGPVAGAAVVGRRTRCRRQDRSSGLTDKDLAARPKALCTSTGGMEQWNGSAASPTIPLTLHRFDRWTGDAEIAKCALALKRTRRRTAGAGERWKLRHIGNPPKVVFIVRKETPANR